MPKTVSIDLPEPIVGRGEPIRRVVLREPTFDEYLQHGDPVTLGVSPEGASFVVENPDVIRAYFAALIVEPKDHLLLELAGFRVAREIKGRILSFFRLDAGDSEGSKTSPTNSSSSASPPSTTSAA